MSRGAPNAKIQRVGPGVVHMVASAFWFSTMALFVKLAGQRLPTMEIVLARALVTLFLSYGWLRLRRRSPWGTAHGLLVLRGLLGFGGLTCFYYAVTHLPLAEATVIHFTSPILTGVLAQLLLGERSGRSVWLGMALGLVGVVFVAQPRTLFAGDGVGLDGAAVAVGLLGATFAAAAYVTVRRLARREDPLVIVFYFPLVALPAAVPLVVPVFQMPHGLEWLWLLAVGVTTQLGQVELTRGLADLPAASATAIGYLQIVFAVAFGAAVFGAQPTPWAVLGGLMVVAGALAAQGASFWRGRRARRLADAAEP